MPKFDEAAELTRHSFYVKAPTFDIDKIMREARQMVYDMTETRLQAVEAASSLVQEIREEISDMQI